MDNGKQPVHLVTALQKRLRVGKAVCPKVFHLLNGHSVIEKRIFQTGAAPHGADDSIVDAPPGIRFKRRPFARLIGIRRRVMSSISDVEREKFKYLQPKSNGGQAGRMCTSFAPLA